MACSKCPPAECERCVSFDLTPEEMGAIRSLDLGHGAIVNFFKSRCASIDKAYPEKKYW